MADFVEISMSEIIQSTTKINEKLHGSTDISPSNPADAAGMIYLGVVMFAWQVKCHGADHDLVMVQLQNMMKEFGDLIKARDVLDGSNNEVVKTPPVFLN